VRLEEVTQFATDLNPALIYNFRSHEEFITRGVGAGILHQGTLSPRFPPQRLAGGNGRSRFRPTVSFVAVGWRVLSAAALNTLLLRARNRSVLGCGE